MSLEVAWRLMFRVNDAPAMERCVARALEILGAKITGNPKPYWKKPELWEVSFRSPFALPAESGVFEVLRTANCLGTGWLVSGPLVTDGAIAVFDGIFNVGTGRPHISGLQWASFSVGQFPSAKPTTESSAPVSAP
jgi:hypothetical protein